MTDQDFYPTNQTEFASESPISQRLEQAYVDPATLETKTQPFLKTKKGKLVVLAMVVVTLLILLLLIAVLSQPKQEKIVQQKAEETVEQKTDLSPIKAKFLELKNLQPEIDPTKQSLPFPQINDKIMVDEKQSN